MWVVEHTTLEAEFAEERLAKDTLGARLEEACEDRSMLESHLASALEMVEKKHKEVLEDTMLMKIAME